jgi:RNA polymerase sigma-70 factor (ECF subfamily)
MRICSVYGHGREDQEDLFQEVVLQAWRSLPSFRGEAGLPTWLYRVAIHVALRHRRTRNKHAHGRLQLEGIEFHSADNEGQTIEEVDRRERVEQLYACIHRLGEIDKSVVTLHLEGLSHREIAEVLGLTENTVAVRVGRCRSKLRACLERVER